jgi:hypothetical protein
MELNSMEEPSALILLLPIQVQEMEALDPEELPMDEEDMEEVDEEAMEEVVEALEEVVEALEEDEVEEAMEEAVIPETTAMIEDGEDEMIEIEMIETDDPLSSFFLFNSHTNLFLILFLLIVVYPLLFPLYIHPSFQPDPNTKPRERSRVTFWTIWNPIFFYARALFLLYDSFGGWTQAPQQQTRSMPGNEINSITHSYNP